jgi:predicted phage terminase large subunit-like protein
MGSCMFAPLYQQRPSPEEGNLLKRQWFKFYPVPPGHFDEIIQSWDLSFKDTKNSDFTVGQCWGRIGSDKYLLDQVRGRMDFPKVVQTMRIFSQKHPQARTVLVEDKANGPALIAVLKKEIPGIIPYSPTDSKVARINAISPQVEAGNVYLPEPGHHPWVSELIEEAICFPTGRFDDQVDCLAQALLRFGNRNFVYDMDLSFVSSMTRQSPFHQPGFSRRR